MGHLHEAEKKQNRIQTGLCLIAYSRHSCYLVFGFSYHYSLSCFVLIHKDMIWFDPIKNLQSTNLADIRL